MQLDQLRAEDFESLLGRLLPLEAAGVCVDCELVEVRRLPSHSWRTSAPFALTLRGPLDKAIGQGICGLLHPEHGRLELFVVPVARTASGFSYEVTFN
jgi:hypothetical protein